MPTIRKIIHRIVPDVEESISYQIPCFKYKGYLIYYSAYTKTFLTRLAKHSLKILKKNLKVSKSEIQLPNNQPIFENFIERIIKFRAEENKIKLKK